jgi:hypothetical protein
MKTWDCDNKITREIRKGADAKSKLSVHKKEDAGHMAISSRTNHMHACVRPVCSVLMDPDKVVVEQPGSGCDPPHLINALRRAPLPITERGHEMCDMQWGWSCLGVQAEIHNDNCFPCMKWSTRWHYLKSKASARVARLWECTTHPSCSQCEWDEPLVLGLLRDKARPPQLTTA